MTPSPLLRFPLVAAIALGPALLLILCLLLQGPHILALCEGSGDYALALLEIEKASRLEALTGPYSRFHVRHPAPSLFYLLAALSKGLHLPGSVRGAVSLAQLLLNTVLLCAATAAIVRSGATIRWSLFTFYLFAFLFSATRPEALYDIWGPSALVAPIFCFMCVAPLVAQGHFQWTFWLVGSAALALSSHMGTVAVIGPVSLLVAASLWSRCATLPTRTPLSTASTAAAALCAAAALLPPAADAWRHGGGNLLRVVQFLASSPGSEKAAGILGAPGFLGYFLAAPFGLPTWLGALLFAAIFLVVAKRHVLHPSAARSEAITVIVACIGAVIGAASIRGAQHHYLMMYMFGIVALALSVAGKPAASVCRHRQPRVGATIALLAFCLFMSASISVRPSEPRHPGCHDALAPFVLRFGLNPSQRVELHPSGAESWEALAASVYRLYRDGYSPCVPPRWGFLVGAGLTCSGEIGVEAPRARFAVVDAARRPVPPSAFQVGDIAWVQEGIPEELPSAAAEPLTLDPPQPLLLG